MTMLKKGNYWQELENEEGSLDKRISSGPLYVPASVELDKKKDRLVWRWVKSYGQERLITVEPTPNLLAQFIDLAGASPDDYSAERILAYARRWGVLGVCKHRIPATHRFSNFGVNINSKYLLKEKKIYTTCLPLGIKSPAHPSFGWEPLESWRHFSRQARAILNIAANLNKIELESEELGRDKDWEILYEWAGSFFQWPTGSYAVKHKGIILVQQKDCIAQAVREWLLLGDVRLSFNWGSTWEDDTFWKYPLEGGDPANPSIKVSYSPEALFGSRLFGALACQLMLWVSRKGGIAFCSECEKLYFPEKRRPKRGQRSYCLECGRKAANKYASNHYRASKKNPMRSLAGVDGCKGGWVCVLEKDGRLTAFVAASFSELLGRLPSYTLVTIDVPIGLTDKGPRACDVEARSYLRPPRASSVFPAPARAALAAKTYEEACSAHSLADGRRMSKQAFSILHKIREVDEALSQHPELQGRVREVHPEVCFAAWNGGFAMRHSKSSRAGRDERELLIDCVWPGERERLWAEVRGLQCRADDLNDAFAALWTARRIRDGVALTFPEPPAADRFGLRMEMLA